MKSRFEQNDLDRMRNDPNNYKWGFFYSNPKDPRCFVPKKIGIGWSFNFANPYSYLIIISIIIFAILIGNLDKILK
jgi:uncharacterized membrane protein